MNIAVLGGGIEGKALKSYFEDKKNHVQIFDNFQDSDIPTFNLEDYDLVFRSPSVRPQFSLDPNNRGKSQNWTSMTKFFFEHCPAKIIGVTGTKGKGTTCTMIATILREIIKNSEWPSRKVFLVGNIGVPSISVLDEISPDDYVVFEMSSFQLWDLSSSPHISVVLRIGEDHLDKHRGIEDYINAKSNITRHQTTEDYCVYCKNNTVSEKISTFSPGKILSYPLDKNTSLTEVLSSLNIPGKHNLENAEAALTAISCIFHLTPNELLQNQTIKQSIIKALKEFKGLPHRIQFVRKLNGVEYYDDSYSSAFPATDVAIKTFENLPLFLIAGGKDRGLDLSIIKKRFFSAKNIKKLILIGETKEKIAANEDPEKYVLAETLENAVNIAKTLAEKVFTDFTSNFDLCIPCTESAKTGKEAPSPVVLLSPGAASFDMFKNFEERGQIFQDIVKNLN